MILRRAENNITFKVTGPSDRQTYTLWPIPFSVLFQTPTCTLNIMVLIRLTVCFIASCNDNNETPRRTYPGNTAYRGQPTWLLIILIIMRTRNAATNWDVLILNRAPRWRPRCVLRLDAIRLGGIENVGFRLANWSWSCIKVSVSLNTHITFSGIESLRESETHETRKTHVIICNAMSYARDVRLLGTLRRSGGK